MHTINVSFEDGEMKVLKKAKSKQTWHDFILDCVVFGDIPISERIELRNRKEGEKSDE